MCLLAQQFGVLNEARRATNMHIPPARALRLAPGALLPQVSSELDMSMECLAA